MFTVVIELLKAIGITDKKRASPVIENAAWAGELAISSAFFAPLLNEVPIVIKMLYPLTLVWDRIFHGIDVVVLGHGHPADIVKLSLTTDAIAAPLVEKATVSVKVLYAMCIHVRDYNRVVGKGVDAGDGIELAFADPFST